MIQIQPLITKKQAKYIRNYAYMHHMTISEVFQMLIFQLQQAERKEEIKKMEENHAKFI